MDFISRFPKVNDLTSVMVVVDRFSKYVVFIVIPISCPLDVAIELFYKHVVKHFGMPKDIISDWDARFTRQFWIILSNIIGTDLEFSTVNYPQTDGQIKRINHMLEEYLIHYVLASQRNWLELLDSA